MSVAPYPEYKDSGVEWIGAVPTHWRVAALRWIAQRYAGGTPEKTKPEYWTDGTIPWLNSGAVNQRLITEASDFITVDAYSNSSTRWVPEGALVMALAGQGKTKGMVAQLAIRATCNQSMAAIVPTAKVISRYLYWWLDAQYQNIRNLAGGDLRDGLNLDLLGQIPCPLPAEDEQSAIASFLDQETGKIDALVAEQERLIALLKEKRQAVISQAVTKGLTPNAPMKDSGIEWLGQVPAHWRVGKAGFYLDVLSGFAFPSEGFSEDEQATRLLRGINVSVGEIRWDDVVYWRRRPDDQLERYLLRQGDLVIGMDRPWIAAGVRVARLGENDTPCLLLQRVARLSVNSKLNDEYLYSLLASDFFIAHFSPDMTGVSVPHISPDQIKSFVIPIPPIPEQHAIISHLKTVVEEIDTLISEATQAIALLRERRAALISAAVTGKIDVRSLAPTKQEAA
jgi:type I restriction enzyme, S subunit